MSKTLDHSSIMIWKIEGEATDRSGSGEYVLFTITEVRGGYVIPPDPDEALKASEGSEDYSWYRINSIKAVAEIPRSWFAHYNDVQTLVLNRLVEDLI